MSYCLNPHCQKPQNPTDANLCRTCRSRLLLCDRYRALKPIGQGGFGRTFLAVDEGQPSKTRCVLKQFFPIDAYLIPSSANLNLKKAAELFEQEALRLNELGKHSQIPELFAYTIQDNRQYVIQEFIEGQNLAQISEISGAFNETQIQEILNQVLPVLHFIHTRNVIHRDIKPENIIRRPTGEFVLVDFGAAKFATGTAFLKTGTSIGSAEYIAPEQARGKAYFASDLYSLGVTCLHLLTQVSPFDLFDPGDNVWVWRQYLVNNSVNEELGRILDKLVENALNRRYGSAIEALKDLNPQAALKLTPALATTRLTKGFLSPESTSLKPNRDRWKCIHTLTGHHQFVNAITLSPNGEVIASGSEDKTIKLWQTEKGQEIITLTGHSNSIHSVDFSPDGELLASGGGDKTIKIWGMKDGQEIRTLLGHDHSIYCVTFSPDGEILASSSWDTTIKLWRIKEGQEIRTLSGHNGLVYWVTFSPDGQLLASSSWDKTIKIWRVADGKLIRTLTGHKEGVRCLAFSPEGELLASGSQDNTIKLWWVKNGQEVLSFKGHTWYIDSLAFSPDGDLIASSSHQTIKVWQVKDGRELQTLADHTNSVYSLAFHPEKNYLVSGSSDKTIKIWQCN